MDDIIKENLERVKTAQEKEIQYRTEKRWKIFSWSSSILIGGIAGAVAIKETQLGCPGRILLSFAVVTLAIYTIFWLDFNRRVLQTARENLKMIDNKLGTYNDVELKAVKIPIWLRIVTYSSTVSLLAIIAILMILIPCLMTWFSLD